MTIEECIELYHRDHKVEETKDHCGVTCAWTLVSLHSDEISENRKKAEEELESKSKNELIQFILNGTSKTEPLTLTEKLTDYTTNAINCQSL